MENILMAIMYGMCFLMGIVCIAYAYIFLRKWKKDEIGKKQDKIKFNIVMCIIVMCGIAFCVLPIFDMFGLLG